MKLLYCTADTIGTPTGGGSVTYQESEALKSLGDSTQVISRKELVEVDRGRLIEPWKWDSLAHSFFGNDVKLAHFYSGTFSESVKKLKKNDSRVIYTVAAHDRVVSKNEHEKLGMGFPYTHLTDESLWTRYIEGYRLADVIVCPSEHSANIVKNYGGCRDVRIIPHGVCLIPDERMRLFPKKFTIGYLGAIGPDKGLIYLLQAWKKLGYTDGSLLFIGGKESKSDFMSWMLQTSGVELANVRLLGWVENVVDFYENITVYVQPSMTEGFGLEVLEAMFCGCPVICSTGAGAADVVPIYWRFPAGDINALADQIDFLKNSHCDLLNNRSSVAKIKANHYSWDKVRQMYVDLWRSLL